MPTEHTQTTVVTDYDAEFVWLIVNENVYTVNVDNGEMTLVEQVRFDAHFAIVCVYVCVCHYHFRNVSYIYIN